MVATDSNASTSDSAVDPVSIYVVDASDPFPAIPANDWLYTIHDQLRVLDDLLSRLPQLLLSNSLHRSASSTTSLSSPTAQPRSLGMPAVNPPKRTSDSSAGSASSSTPPSTSPDTCCPLAAIDTAAQVLQQLGVNCSRILVFTTNHSTTGIGKIRRREVLGLYCSPAELSLYGSLESIRELTVAAAEKESCAEYLRVTDLCVSAKIAVNVLVFTSEEDFVDVALLSDSCDKTGGACNIFHGSLLRKDSVIRLKNELQAMLHGMGAFDAVAKV